MNANIDQLVLWLESDFCLEPPISEEEILQARDHTAFDADWVAASGLLEEKFKACYCEPAFDSAITKVREVAFLKVFAATGSHELSACASDDFGLVAKAIVCGEEKSEFVSRLRLCYLSGRIAT